MDERHRPEVPPARWEPTYGIVAGAGIGVVLGALTGRLALWIVVGAGVGLVGGAIVGATVDDDRRRLLPAAAAVLLAGTAIVLVVLAAG